jgi:DNA-binding FadR family transcriptional regulator
MDRKFFEDYCEERMRGVVMLPKKDFVKEHKNIVKILKKGDPKELKKEAREQQSELTTELRKMKRGHS